MKAISKSIRIARVRRRSVSPTPLDNQTSIKPQVRSVSHRKKEPTNVPSPQIPRLNDLQEVNSTDQHSNIPASLVPHSTIRLKNETPTNHLDEIPSKTKSWSKKKKILVGVIAASIVAVVIILVTVLSVVLTRSIVTTTTIMTSTTSTTVISAFWSFDNTTAEANGVYNGQLINSATYSPISNNIPYVGHGRALYVIASSNQSFLVPNTTLDLSNTSFTIEAWIYPMITSGDRGIFSLCQCSTCLNQCFYFILRSTRLYVGFTLNDLSGSTSLTAFNWYHVTFVYNYQTQQQILYVNGVQDTIKSNAQPYQSKNGTIQIGSTQVYSTVNFFSGYIDNLFLITQAKSSDEILRDASLLAYYSFDLPFQTIDASSNGLNGTSLNTVTVTGRVNQALRLVGSSSYFQAYGFYNMPYGVSSGKPFSVSLWAYPSSASSSTFIQLYSTALSTYSCANLLGIYSAASLAGQITVMSAYNGPATLTGPFISQTTWTHISLTYGTTNGYTLYINGIAFGATGAVSFPATGSFAYLFVGYYGSCYYGSSNNAYQGSIDEVYIHNRELSQSDVTSLANP